MDGVGERASVVMGRSQDSLLCSGKTLESQRREVTLSMLQFSKTEGECILGREEGGRTRSSVLVVTSLSCDVKPTLFALFI